jgi:hypothetical protein
LNNQAPCYSLRNLFRDDQRHILSIILGSTLVNAEGVYRQVYEDNAPLLLFLKDIAVPAPRALAAAAEYVLNASFKREFEENTLNLTRIQNLVDAAKMHGVALEGQRNHHRSRMERMAEATTSRQLVSSQELDASQTSCRFQFKSTCASFKAFIPHSPGDL